MGIARYRLRLMLTEPYVGSTLRAIHARSGPYRSHSTPRQLVVDHCAHWRDMLAEPEYARLTSETARLRRLVPDIDDALLAYARECAGATVVSIDPAVLVVCALHHLHALAAHRDLDAEACGKAVGRALKSVRDIVRGVSLDAHLAPFTDPAPPV
jgi:hypothetical protein